MFSRSRYGAHSHVARSQPHLLPRVDKNPEQPYAALLEERDSKNGSHPLLSMSSAVCVLAIVWFREAPLAAVDEHFAIDPAYASEPANVVHAPCPQTASMLGLDLSVRWLFLPDVLQRPDLILGQNRAVSRRLRPATDPRPEDRD